MRRFPAYRRRAPPLGPKLAVVAGWVGLIAVVLLEPRGLYGAWLKVRTWLQLFPFYRRGLLKRQKSYQKSERLR